MSRRALGLAKGHPVSAVESSHDFRASSGKDSSKDGSKDDDSAERGTCVSVSLCVSLSI